MNNEINEILAEMKSIIDTGKNRNGIKVDGYGLRQNELKVLLDYITNLQQDNTMYAQLKDEYEEEIKDLQQENERLKERNKEIYEGYMSVVDELTEYAEENERLKKH